MKKLSLILLLIALVSMLLCSCDIQALLGGAGGAGGEGGQPKMLGSQGDPGETGATGSIYPEMNGNVSGPQHGPRG